MRKKSPIIPEIRLGLRRPENESPISKQSPAELRKIINHSRTVSPLIGWVLSYAEDHNMSSEDTYTLLAYESLCLVQKYMDEMFELTGSF
jgi:hypothetical protein